MLDPFLGTGSTTLAAMETSRNSIGFEVSENYWRDLRSSLGLLFPAHMDVSFERSRARDD